MANIALLGGLVARVEHDNNNAAVADKVQPVACTKVNSHLGDFALDRLPVSQIPCFCLPQARCDADLRFLVFQGIEPGDEFFGLEDCEPASTVAKWILRIKRSAFGAVQRSSQPACRSRSGWAMGETSGGDALRECLLSQRVDALPLSLSGYREPFMKFGRNSKVELA